jgi:Tol biopolymer transport system component/DNA-binding winged helix-turn-helix (wHTH) protein
MGEPEARQLDRSKGSPAPAGNVRFGPFALDLRGRELCKEGRRIRLQEQPFLILRMLLESPGEVVTREEIRQRLWPDDTVVEFDHSINAAVKRLRDVLRDSAGKPRYIETLPRRGYRFVGEVEVLEQPVPVSEPVAVVLENAPATRTAEPVVARPPFLLRRLRILVPALAAAIILIIGAGAWYYRHGARPLLAPLQPLMRLDLDLGIDVPPNSESGANAVLSPDGRRLVYRSQSKLFTRRLDQPTATELPGTQGAQAPFFSPDGQWVAFFAQGKLKRVSAQGGPVIFVSEAAGAAGGSWGEDGSIVAGLNFRLSRISSTGGTPARLMELASGEIAHRWPQVLPGGKAVLFSAYTSMTGLDGATIEALSSRDGRRKTLVRGGTFGRYLPGGHLVYIDKGTLFAVPFDPDRLEVHGTPVPVLEDVAYSAAWGSAQIEFSKTGTLVYRGGKVAGGLVTVRWLDGSGNEQPLLPVPGNYLSPTLSPDGGRLALTSAGDIWVYELRRGSMTRLTFGGGYGNPLWTPDGRYIVFRAARGMFWTRADGTVQPQPLTQSTNQQISWSFSGDGKRLAFVELNSASRADIWTLPVETSSSGLRAGKPEVFLQTPFNERGPAFSPDGRWIAYQSNESGRYEVYVHAFPDGHGKRQISGDTGTNPAWSRNGRDLFFWTFGGPRNHLMAASYRVLGDSFVADKPRVWSEKRPVTFTSTRSYDPAPDGKRIVALMPAETPEEPPGHLIFLLNFFDELRRRVPVEPR